MPKLKILIIDDEVDYCLIMKSYFQEKGYEVSMAYKLNEGLAMLEKTRPEILILDNNLPDGQGWECVGEIVEKFPQLRLYLVSAYKQKADFVSSSPNIIVWEKPISFSELETIFN